MDRNDQHTLLCKWMVYSRDTTSAMAERPLFFPLVVLDISVPTFSIDDLWKMNRGKGLTSRCAGLSFSLSSSSG